MHSVTDAQGKVNRVSHSCAVLPAGCDRGVRRWYHGIGEYHNRHPGILRLGPSRRGRLRSLAALTSARYFSPWGSRKEREDASVVPSPTFSVGSGPGAADAPRISRPLDLGAPSARRIGRSRRSAWRNRFCEHRSVPMRIKWRRPFSDVRRVAAALLHLRCPPGPAQRASTRSRGRRPSPGTRPSPRRCPRPRVPCGCNSICRMGVSASIRWSHRFGRKCPTHD